MANMNVSRKSVESEDGSADVSRERGAVSAQELAIDILRQTIIDTLVDELRVTYYHAVDRPADNAARRTAIAKRLSIVDPKDYLSVTSLITYGMRDDCPEVKIACAESLAEIGLRMNWVQGSLETLLHSEHEDKVSLAGASALLSLGLGRDRPIRCLERLAKSNGIFLPSTLAVFNETGHRAVELLLDAEAFTDESVRIYQNILEDRNPHCWNRKYLSRTVSLAGQYGFDAMPLVPGLIAQLGREGSLEFQREVVEALSSIAQRDSMHVYMVPLLEDALLSPQVSSSPRFRKNVVHVLKKLGPLAKESAPGLLAHVLRFQDKHESYYSSELAALKEMGPEIAFAVTSVLEKAGKSLTVELLEVLAKTGGPPELVVKKVKAIFLQGLKECDTELVRAAAATLKTHSKSLDPKLISELVNNGLSHTNSRIRSICEGLISFIGKPALPAIKEALEENSQSPFGLVLQLSGVGRRLHFYPQKDCGGHQWLSALGLLDADVWTLQVSCMNVLSGMGSQAASALPLLEPFQERLNLNTRARVSWTAKALKGDFEKKDLARAG